MIVVGMLYAVLYTCAGPCSSKTPVAWATQVAIRWIAVQAVVTYAGSERPWLSKWKISAAFA